ncbi:ATP-binding transport ABC transporter protein [Rhodovulum sulfidophilum]|uniref:ATP-binding transport ABC transporter protein n=1 Tax=Rhodovulum sulfidophilum TaxID=35806 RepID=A0A0D6AXM3_RHOSU|nr:ATP-binding transport ABC transporter protein [Rhodovulum sulfidophilum]
MQDQKAGQQIVERLEAEALALQKLGHAPALDRAIGRGPVFEGKSQAIRRQAGVWFCGGNGSGRDKQVQ